MTAAYLQLALAIERCQGSRVCPECGQPFIVTKANKVHCTDTCSGAARKRRYDKRRLANLGED